MSFVVTRDDWIKLTQRVDAIEATLDTVDTFNTVNIDGTLTDVYTKYLTGTLDSDDSTSVAHGLTDADKIMHVSVACYDSSRLAYRVYDHRTAVDQASGYKVKFDDINVIIDGVGADIQGQNYRVKVDYIL
jgi:hypothetical protein